MRATFLGLVAETGRKSRADRSLLPRREIHHQRALRQLGHLSHLLDPEDVKTVPILEPVKQIRIGPSDIHRDRTDYSGDFRILTRTVLRLLQRKIEQGPSGPITD